MRLRDVSKIFNKMMWVENDEIWKFRKMKNDGGIFTHNDEEYEVVDVFQDRNGRWCVSLYLVR